jgi:hypothetical protein
MPHDPETEDGDIAFVLGLRAVLSYVGEARCLGLLTLYSRHCFYFRLEGRLLQEQTGTFDKWCFLHVRTICSTWL